MTTGDFTRPERLLTLDELRARCRWWQELLRLQDWDIEVRLVRQTALSDRDNAGELHPYERKKRAVILVVEPEDYRLTNTSVMFIKQDMEYTLVHELVHLIFGFVPRKPETEVFEEQAVHTTARALLALSRHTLPLSS